MMFRKRGELPCLGEANWPWLWECKNISSVTSWRCHKVNGRLHKLIYASLDDNNKSVGFFSFFLLPWRKYAKRRWRRWGKEGGTEMSQRWRHLQSVADMSLSLWEDCAFLEWHWEEMEILYNYWNSTRNSCVEITQIQWI